MKATVRVAPAAAAFFAASFLALSCAATAAVAAAPQTGTDGHLALQDEDEPHTDYCCTVELHGARRPMLTEKEMKRFDESFQKCTVQIAEYQDLEKPELEIVVVDCQEWDPGRRRLLGGGGKERRQLRSENLVKVSARCRRCAPDDLIYDRRLEGEEAEVGHSHFDRILRTFDDCMLYELSHDIDGDDRDLAAFHNLDEVSTSCSIMLEGLTFNDLADGGNDTLADATTVCDTIIHHAPAPMLSQGEMLHFDCCWKDEYNAFHSIDPTKDLIVSSEVVDQQLQGGTNILGRRLDDANRVRSLKGTCSNCTKPEVPEVPTTRKLTADNNGRELEINIKTFEDRLRDCLMSGIDAKTNTTYPAFAAEIIVETKCDEPVPTVQELEKQQAQAHDVFMEVLVSEEEKFEKEWEEEEKQLKLAEVQHKAKKDKFEFRQKEKEWEFKQYQAYMAEVAALQMKSSCVRVMERSGCDDVMDMLPTNLIWVKDAKVLGVKIDIQQGIGIDPITGQCAVEDREEQFYVHFVKEKKDDESLVYEFKVETEKCGNTKSYESKYCYWDGSESIMAADFEVLFPIAVLLREELKVNGGPDEDEQVFLNARDRARDGKDNCYVHYKVDCNCQALPT